MLNKIMKNCLYLLCGLYLKVKKANVGEKALLGNKFPIISNRGKLKFGNNLKIRSTQFRTEIGVGENGTLDIGNNVFINQGVTIYASNNIQIKDYVRIGDLTAIYDTNFHEVEEGSGVKSLPVTIEKNVWIGRGCIILPGVTIGENSVIGAGSVVKFSIPSNTLASGNPASVIKELKCSTSYIRR